MTPPVVPAVPGIPAGYGPVQADVDSWVTTPFSFLASPVVFRGELHAAQALTSVTLLQLDTILEDPWGGWTPANFSWACPAGCDGLYEVSLNAWATPVSSIQCLLYVDGAVYSQGGPQWGSASSAGATWAAQVPLLGGIDSLQFYVASTSGATAAGVAGRYPAMEISWMSTT